MIDMHCHVLPWVDDGASSLEEGLALVEVAAASGIGTMVLTPKVDPGRHDNTRTNLTRKFDAFRTLAIRRGLEVELHLGAEAILSPAMMELLGGGEVPFVGRWCGHDVLLLRWQEPYIPVGAVGAMKQMLDQHVLPMLVHPERNPGVVRFPQALEMFVGEGCLIQVDSASLIGTHGPEVEATARLLIERGWASVVASNARSAIESPARLRRGFEILADLYGADRARALVVDHPAALLRVDPNEAAGLRDAPDPIATDEVPTLPPEFQISGRRSPGFVHPSNVSVH